MCSVPCGFGPRVDDAATEILRVARESHYDLIVMGTQGRSGLGRLLMGSVAEEVVRKASGPVMTVRSPHGALIASEDKAHAFGD